MNLPSLPKRLTMSMVARCDDFAYTADQMRAYGQQCRQQALEQVVRMLMAEHEHSRHFHNYALVYANEVRALMKDKP